MMRQSAIWLTSLGVVSTLGCGVGDPLPAQVQYSKVPVTTQVATLPTVPVGAPMGATQPTAMEPAAQPPAATTPAMSGTPAATPGTTGTAGTAAAPMNTAGAAAPIMMGAAGTGSMMGAAGAATPPAGGAEPTMLTFQVTTKTQGMKYAPKNVGAVWVEDTNGKWIHTLEYWGGFPNGTHLTRYSKAGGPDYELFFGTPATPVPADTISGATLNMHKAHTGEKWNLKDSKGTVIADGNYRVVIEVTEDAVTGTPQEVPFTKGPMPVTMMPADAPYYTGMQLTLQ